MPSMALAQSTLKGLCLGLFYRALTMPVRLGHRVLWQCGPNDYG